MAGHARLRVKVFAPNQRHIDFTAMGFIVKDIVEGVASELEAANDETLKSELTKRLTMMKRDADLDQMQFKVGDRRFRVEPA